MSARALMILGTASHVGKSLLTAGLGRIFADDGIHVAPFKAQNMSLNSAATPDGREIGRAQALQAEACRVVPCAEMNPILIKPSSDTASQIVLLGRVWGQVTASDYHQRRVEDLFPAVLTSYRTLAERFDLILLEGAGSPAEINLREHDIVNMRMAHAADAACVLIGDIDRGGVFAALLGTVELLEPEDRARIRGFVINKFRGDGALLRPGVETMEKRLGIPCIGVVPFLRGVGLEEEDGVAMESRRTPDRTWRFPETTDRPLRVGVVALPHMANFTDFDALAMEPSVALAFLEDPGQADVADVLILPGSKQTLDDLVWLRARGFAEGLAAFSGLLIGICGGFQILGLSIEDPSGAESAGMPRTMAGLAILPVRTVMRCEKTVRRAAGIPRLASAPPFSGYEIHMGETIYENAASPFAEIVREGERQPVADGAMASSGRSWGTYVHGIFDDDAFRHSFVDSARASRGLAPALDHVCTKAERQGRIDRWADHLRQSLDMNLIRGWALGRGAKETGGGR
ncbi:MAG TPA: cobyric acid synthase [Bryobacteraceae bacterium]|nr:cobyric acid synthase [Xanthobacteraceae bacterium]HXP84656.1 cobyric acid synthase [Bryobacteraceae bacterium]